ncbi:MAG TPA: hypothetical protein VGP26_08585 [Actinophytocola sp.]|nr:hypothetical protein [Actinophytocola sp.]
MSLHSRSDTESPNHMCAISCTTASMPTSDSVSAPYVGRVWFSRPFWPDVIVPPIASNGYSPDTDDSYATISGVRSIIASIAGRSGMFVS